MSEQHIKVVVQRLEALQEIESTKLIRKEVIIGFQKEITRDYINQVVGVPLTPNVSISSHDRAMNADEKNVHKTKIFICYAHKDNEHSNQEKCWLNRLLEYLGPFEKQQNLDPWCDKDIDIGSEWDADIQTRLDSAKAAVLLVSPAFLNSTYIRNSELPVLLQRAKEKGVVIFPVVLRRCAALDKVLFKYPDPTNGPHVMSLADLQGAHPTNKPLNSLLEHEQDEVLASLVERLLDLSPENL